MERHLQPASPLPCPCLKSADGHKQLETFQLAQDVNQLFEVLVHPVEPVLLVSACRTGLAEKELLGRMAVSGRGYLTEMYILALLLYVNLNT